MYILKNKFILVGSALLLLFSWYLLTDSSPNKNNGNEVLLTKIEPVKSTNEIIKVKNIDNKSKINAQFINKVNYNAKSYQTTQQSPHIDRREAMREKYILEQKRRDFQAKKQYEREQQYRVQQSTAYKGREDYYKTQQILTSRNLNNTQDRSQMMQSKQTRNYMAKINYQKRQKQIQEQMKMRSRVVK